MEGRSELYLEHISDLKKSGLTKDTIDAAGLRSIPAAEIRAALGFGVDGATNLLAFPYPGVKGFSRYKVFYQPGFKGKRLRYLQRKGSGNHLYIPEKCDRSFLTSIPVST